MSDYDLHFLSNDGQGPIVIYISGDHAQNQAEEVYGQARLSAGLRFDFCEVRVHDWDRFLTPWAAANCMKGRIFAGEGETLLKCFSEDIVPRIIEKFPGHRAMYLAGYSLAGLFSLWSLYESGLFDGAVCGSGSLWYPGWKEYMLQSSLTRKAEVYLSLGRREPESKHPLMKQVGEITKLQYESLQKNENVKEVTFEWNDGGHFSDVADRMARGVHWIVS